MKIYEQLKQKADPFIKYYRDDLLVHDLNALNKNPGIPFLHFTGETGTHIVFLRPAEDYPEEPYPYLFGMTTREKEIHDLPEIVASMKTRYDREDLALYYNGKQLREVAYPEVTRIARDYVYRVVAQWRKKQS